MKNPGLIPIAIITLSVISINSIHGQEISTVAEIYDFEIGDIFHFEYTEMNGWYDKESITNIEILDQYYSSNDDTLFYIRDIDYKAWNNTWWVWTYSYYTDTIFYTQLDSLINSGDIDTVYSNINEYNGRMVNFQENITITEYSALRFVNGCGKVNASYHCQGLMAAVYDKLVYFKKGDEEWGFPNIVLSIGKVEESNSITLYPNPADQWIYIKTNNLNLSHNYNIELYSLQGLLVKEAKNIQSSHYTLNVIDLIAGVYFYVIKDKDRVLQQGKVVIK